VFILISITIFPFYVSLGQKKEQKVLRLIKLDFIIVLVQKEVGRKPELT
jgi:hypothetical protein